MLFSPNSIQKQLSDAITVIGKHDFPDKWPELIGQMVEKFNTPNFHIICGVLHTAHSLFKRYRYSIKSQELWTEIKYVLDQFAKPLTDLFVVSRFSQLRSLLSLTLQFFFIFFIGNYGVDAKTCKWSSSFKSHLQLTVDSLQSFLLSQFPSE